MMGPVMGLGIFAAVALLIAINVTAGEGKLCKEDTVLYYAEKI